LTVSSKWNEAGFAVSQAATSEPMEVTFSGKIGYLVSGDTLLAEYNAALGKVSNSLSIVQGSYLGGLAGQQLKTVQGAVNNLQKAAAAVDNFATKIRNISNGINGVDRLLIMKEDLRSIYDLHLLVRIDAPLDTIENAIITSLTFGYPDQSEQYLEVSISLKEVRFVTIKTANLDKANFSQQMCRADIGMSAATNNGTAATGDIPASATAGRNTTALYRANGYLGAL